METRATEAEVASMVQSLCASRRPIPLSAAIFHDLGIAGDDAFELLENIAGRYKTSFAAFDFHSYFPEEGAEALLCYWALRLGFRQKFKRLTIRHLAAVVERGSWFEPSLAE